MKWCGKIKDNKNQHSIINMLCDFEWVSFPIWVSQLKGLESILLPHPPPIMENNLVVCMFVCMCTCGSSKHNWAHLTRFCFMFFSLSPRDVT